MLNFCVVFHQQFTVVHITIQGKQYYHSNVVIDSR